MSILILAVNSQDVDVAADYLWGLGAIAIEERNDDQIDGPVTLVAGFEDDAAAKAAHTTVSDKWTSRLEQPPDEAEWRDAWLHHLAAVRVGPLLIYPPWNPPAATSETTASPEIAGDFGIPISIDPGRAFGSGHHTSTQLAVCGLHQLIVAGDAVLDVGCGTGVLAIAAVVFGAGHATGIDLDRDIIAVAQTNATANAVADRIDLSATPLADITTTFDLVVANITSRSLEPLIPGIVAAARRDVVVSGLLTDQREFLEDAFGRPATQVWGDDEWSALHFAMNS